MRESASFFEPYRSAIFKVVNRGLRFFVCVGKFSQATKKRSQINLFVLTEESFDYLKGIAPDGIFDWFNLFGAFRCYTLIPGNRCLFEVKRDTVGVGVSGSFK